MHELQRIHDAVAGLMARTSRGLLVTVIATRGSTYRKAGARSVIGEDGSVTGAISGGCVERDLALRAQWNDFTPRLVTYDSSSADDIVFGLGLGCRGSITMRVEPFDAAHPPELPPVPEPKRIAIFGRGPDADPVETMARAAGWEPEVVRTREIPNLDRYDAIVIMTHNFLDDVAIVDAAFRSRAEYIGLLGPKKRGEEILTQIDDPGEERRRRLHNPIGLDLGGETPADIALSIVAEIQAVLHRRDAKPLREKATPIHERTVAIVLAAGLSTRFGSSKQLFEIDGEPMVRRAARVAIGAGCDETIVVVSAAEVAAALHDLPVTLVQNAEPSEGIAGSIRAAVEAAGHARLLFTLCDQPLVTADHLRALLATSAPIVASGYGETAGVPAAFAPELREELLALRGDRGARAVIEHHRDRTTIVPFEPAHVDIDTPNDVRNAGVLAG